MTYPKPFAAEAGHADPVDERLPGSGPARQLRPRARRRRLDPRVGALSVPIGQPVSHSVLPRHRLPANHRGSKSEPHAMAIGASLARNLNSKAGRNKAHKPTSVPASLAISLSSAVVYQ